MELSDIFANAIATAALAVVAAFGGVLNSWLKRRERYCKDLAAAKEKIRKICNAIDMDPCEIKNIDDVFDALRKIDTILERNGLK